MLISSFRENIVILIVFEIINNATRKSIDTSPALTIVTARRTVTSLLARSLFSRTLYTPSSFSISLTVSLNLERSLTVTLKASGSGLVLKPSNKAESPPISSI